MCCNRVSVRLPFVDSYAGITTPHHRVLKRQVGTAGRELRPVLGLTEDLIVIDNELEVGAHESPGIGFSDSLLRVYFAHSASHLSSSRFHHGRISMSHAPADWAKRNLRGFFTQGGSAVGPYLAVTFRAVACLAIEFRLLSAVGIVLSNHG